MTVALSDVWADNLVNLFLGLPFAPASLPTMHLQLYVVMPLFDGVSPGVTPSSSVGYLGPIDVHGAGFWPSATVGAGETLLAADVGFGTPTADWGPIVGCAFTEADGTLITLGEEFDTPYDVVVGVPFVLPAASVSFSAATAG